MLKPSNLCVQLFTRVKGQKQLPCNFKWEVEFVRVTNKVQRKALVCHPTAPVMLSADASPPCQHTFTLSNSADNCVVVEDQVPYQVDIQTASGMVTGTDLHVLITLTGDKSHFGVKALPTAAKYYEAGKTDTFTFMETNVDTPGAKLKIEVGTDAGFELNYDDWSMQSIKITNIQTSRWWEYFKQGDTIAFSNSNRWQELAPAKESSPGCPRNPNPQPGIIWPPCEGTTATCTAQCDVSQGYEQGPVTVICSNGAWGTPSAQCVKKVMTSCPSTSPAAQWTKPILTTPASIQISSCPDKYPVPAQGCLGAVRAAHPHWRFEFYDATMSLSRALAVQRTLERSDNTVSLGARPDWVIPDSSLAEKDDNYPATDAAITFMMDPRNFMNDGVKASDAGCCLEDSNGHTDMDNLGIFQFADQGYISGELIDAKDYVVAALASYLDKSYWTSWGSNIARATEFAEYICDAGIRNGVHPLLLAAKISQEGGLKDQELVSTLRDGFVCPDSGQPCSGQCLDPKFAPGCEGATCQPGAKVFNYCGIGAYTGGCNIQQGAAYAFKEGWSTEKAAIIGCAKFTFTDYICRGQDTYYLERWDLPGWVARPGKNGWPHQYASNIDAAHGKGMILGNIVRNYGFTNYPLKFKIPVYKEGA